MQNIEDKIQNNIVLGSGHSLGYKDNNLTNFISTDQDELDLLNRFEITQYIPKQSITVLFANHVFEHIFPDALWNVFQNINYMNKIGGYLILCVPDFNSYTSQYFKSKDEAMIFQPKAGHFIYFTIESISYILHESGYEVKPIYFHINNIGVRNKDINSILDEFRLRKFIEDRLKSDPYSLCVSSKKVK